MILPAGAAIDLRNYIAAKNPTLSPASRAGIFADAINRIVDGRLPRFGDNTDLRKRLKRNLYSDTAAKPVFSIDCADVFKASVKLKAIGFDFFRGLNEWVSGVLKKPVVRESLYSLVVFIHRLMETAPDDEVDSFIELFEMDRGGLKFSEIETEQAGTAAIASAEVALATANSAPTAYVGRMERLESLPPFESYYRKNSRLLDLIRKFLEFIEPKMPLVTSALAVMLTFVLITGSAGNIAPVDNTLRTQYSTPAAPAITPAVIEIPGPVESVPEASPTVIRMKATAYDLSYKSCGKTPDHPAYGITKSGTRATVGRTVAVDPEVIPLGSRLYITFPEEYAHLNGEYIAEDTGSLIKGNSIDIFFGEDKEGSTEVYDNAMEFGVRYVDVQVLE